MNTNDMDNLSAWLDGELKKEQADEVHKMLFNDAQAAMACADFRKLDKLLQRWDAPQPPVLLEEVICISAKHDPRKNPFYRFIQLAVPLAVAAILVLVIMMWMGGVISSDGSSDLEWSSLTPQQQSQASEDAKAFLMLSKSRQDRILKEFQSQFNISPSQNNWVGPVLSSFTVQQRDELLKLSPEKRLEILRKRHIEMMASGMVVAEEPVEK